MSSSQPFFPKEKKRLIRPDDDMFDAMYMFDAGFPFQCTKAQYYYNKYDDSGGV